ncbi:Nucleoporin nup35 [Branchiostoma belcheri]|nr:Nucleoporin nup35 [Branchiostoma belcheri]
MDSQAHEPMTLGSPTHGPSAGGATFLPGFLLGDPPAAPSPSFGAGRTWSSPHQLSSSFSRQQSVSTPSSLGPGSGLGRSMSIQSGSTPGSGHTHLTPRSDRLEGKGTTLHSVSKDKSGAPPVQGLFSHTSTPTGAVFRGTPERQQLEFSVSRTPVLTGVAHTTPSGGVLFSPGPTPRVQNVQKPSPPSPAQTDPFYTQGEALTAEDQLDETWVTVFGFPPAATSFILQQFSQYGNIVKHVIASNGNWLHLHYQSKMQAKKALSKNGKVFGGSIMVGVTLCIDKSVMEQTVEPSTETSSSSAVFTPIRPRHQSEGAVSRHTPIRPLTAAYKAASNEHEVVNDSKTPQKNGNMVYKAMEYMFGW